MQTLTAISVLLTVSGILGFYVTAVSVGNPPRFLNVINASSVLIQVISAGVVLIGVVLLMIDGLKRPRR